MMTSTTQRKNVQKAKNTTQAESLLNDATNTFQGIFKKYFYFNFAFASLLFIELAFIGFFFTSLVSLFFLGVAIAILFFTLLCYFILRLYFMEQKSEELKMLKNAFMDRAKAIFGSDAAKKSLEMAEEKLDENGAFCLFPEHLSFLTPLSEQIGVCRRFYKEDVRHAKELFLKAAIAEYIEEVKKTPLRFEPHKNMGQAYIKLARLYDEISPFAKKPQEVKKMRKMAYERAIIELKIAHDYADRQDASPPLLEELAFCYHELGCAKEEAETLEELLHFAPGNAMVLFTLGQLRFKQGEHSKGLKLYEMLKKTNPEQAQKLLEEYGA